MAMPRKLKHMNIFEDGVSYIGQAKEISTPKLALKTESYRGGGMLAEVEIDMGLEKLELEITFGGLMPDTVKKFGVAKLDGVQLRFAGSYQSEDTGTVDAIEIAMRGRYTEIDPDKAKAGDDTEMKVKAALTYYKLSINGADIVEIDVVNMIYIVNGVDRMAEHRKAIGV